MSTRSSNQQRSAFTVALSEQLTRAGYGSVRHEVLELDPVPAVCVLAQL